jgi:RsiW-degrading membrane proteinase PrsW (M82 family)
MYGTWVLLVLIFISSLPVIAIYIWFRIAKFQFSIVWFLFALLAGAAAFFPALVLQDLLSFPVFAQIRTALFYEFFIRIALTEELSRLLMLFIFFWISSLVSKGNIANQEDLPTSELSDNQSLSSSIIKKGTATGLIAGLGFAILENARLAASSMDFNIALLRIFTTALHGACGARVGVAAVMFPGNPVRALLRVFTATAIHGVFNFMVVRPGLTSIVAFLIAACALLTSIFSIRGAPTKAQEL